MSSLVWLASYPKSGNTWFRMLVANLSNSSEAPVDINNLPERGGIASAREPFDRLTLIESGNLSHDEADVLRPRLYEALAAQEDEAEAEDGTTEPRSAPRLMKVHDAYTMTRRGEPLLTGGDRAILVVRDPRGVAASLANHSRTDLDGAIRFMASEASVFAGSRRRQPIQLRQKLLSWSAHAESWLDQHDLPVHLVRYEDLAADTAGVLRIALAFTGREASQEAIERAVRLASFAALRSQEHEAGFREAPVGVRFFRRGSPDAWREELTDEQVARIEKDHGRIMQRLGYALDSDALDSAETPPQQAAAQTGA